MTRKFQVDCHYLADWPRTFRMTEAQVVAHVRGCGNAHSITRDGEPYFVVGGAS